MLDSHCEESSTDDIDNVNHDNYVMFVGDNIIIGRSNLRKENTSTPRKVSSTFLVVLQVVRNIVYFIVSQ